MTTPFTATYRLQFRNGMTFERAADLAGYLAALGISHLYASPIFAAAPGSTHGYDVARNDRFDEALGGEEGFVRLSDTLKSEGLGLILDFVPNHMAANEANPWWHSVLEWGRQSPYARHFDVDWSAPRLLLPVLGEPYGTMIERGEFAVTQAPGAGGFDLALYDRTLPLTPPSYARILDRVDHREAKALGEAFAETTAGSAAELKGELARLAGDQAFRAKIDETLDALSAQDIHALHEAQPWRLAHWRLGREALSYRRFFEISDLVCLRIEDPAVFEDVHARLRALIDEGRVEGLRIDHIDGLADPKGYLERLRGLCPGKAFPVFVEKILEGSEEPRRDWPMSGTTGYEFITALAGLFVDRAQRADMTEAYEGFTGDRVAFDRQIADCKREILSRNLASELDALTERAVLIASGSLKTRDLGRDSLRQAIVEFIAALPVYRTYVDGNDIDPLDRVLIEQAARSARTARRIDNPAAIDFIERLALLEPPEPSLKDEVRAFAVRLQQTSGPVMAKGAEDTVYYRYNRLIALNEVGGAPDVFGASCEVFHAAMARRQANEPDGLSATATHDTKRGEDARARLYALSEMPQQWCAATERWSAMNAAFRRRLEGGVAPDRADEWLFYQALAGVWPAELIGEERPDLEPLCARMRAFMEKALREAKRRTSWTDQASAYEDAVAEFVRQALSWSTGAAFLSDFAATCAPLWRAGALNGLSQLAIKLTAPGVPDIYQGSEVWDFSLVDPDNRRPVDFTRLAEMAEVSTATTDPMNDWQSGAPKFALLRAGLRLRGERPELFSQGVYRALKVRGRFADNVLAFARLKGRDMAITVVPRLALSLLAGARHPHIEPSRWQDTVVELPGSAAGREFVDVVTGETMEINGPVAVERMLARFPVAILASAG